MATPSACPIASIDVFATRPTLLLAAGPHRSIDMTGIEMRDDSLQSHAGRRRLGRGQSGR